MATMLDYLDWRGDLSFAQSPFNEVDNLILSQLSYLDVTGAADPDARGRGPTLERVWKRFCALHDVGAGEGAPGGVVSPLTVRLLEKVAASERFGRTVLCHYVERLEEDGQRSEQFSAMCFRLPDKSTYVAFRGTDASFAGWREDFAMSFSVVPSQRSATRYLEEVRRHTRGPLRVGGHSKGGNLAVYAAAQASKATQRRLVEVWSNDGPGFGEGMLSRDAFKSIRAKVHHLVPAFCVVGQLLEQPCHPQLIRADGVGVMQHDAMLWQVMGARFVPAEAMDEGAVRFGEVFASVMGGKDSLWRWRLTDALFGALEAGGSSIDEIQQEGAGAYLRVAQAYLRIDPELRDAVRTIASSIAGESVTQGVSSMARRILVP